MDPDDLSELERRLSARRPSASGLDADAMLFAAGRASAPRPLLWPALAGLLAVLSLGLGWWATAERAERLALTRQLRQRPTAPPEPAAPPAVIPESGRSADDWLSARRALEDGLEAWPPVATPDPEGPAPGRPEPVFTVGQLDALLGP